MKLNVIHEGVTENGFRLTVGMVVEYGGHVPGGMVRVKLPDGTLDVAHPGCFAEFVQ